MSDPQAAPTAAAGRGWLAPLFLAVLSIALFAPTLNFELVYDDAFLIVNNASMQPARTDFGAALELFTRSYWEGVSPERAEALRTHGQALYRPLTLFLWACLVYVNGVETTWPYHLLSILANALVVVLLYRFVRRVWERPRMAFVAALLFALHPLHSEAVAYVAGLSDLLAAVSVLGGLLLYERATREPGRLARGPWLGLLGCLFVGLLAKEQAAVLIAAVALTDWMLSMRGRRSTGGVRLAVYGGLVVALALHLLLRYVAIGELVPDRTAIPPIDNPLIQEPFGIRLLNGLKLIAMQVWLLFWPQHLSIDYSFNAVPVSRSLGQAEPLAAAVLVLAMLAFGLVNLKRRPAIGWGVLFFLGTAVYTSNILVPIGTLFGERLTYLPSMGACLAVAAVLDPLLKDRRKPQSATAVNAGGLLVLLVVSGALGVRTWDRNQQFSSSEKLFDAALSVVPNSARVHFQYAMLINAQGLHTKAEEHLQRSLEIDPTFIQATIGLGDVYNAARNWDKAISVYDRVLQTFRAVPGASPEQYNAVAQLVYRGRARAKQGKGDLAGAQADLQQVISVTSDSPGGYVDMAQLLIERDQAAEAIPLLRTALQLNPENVNVLYLLARAAYRSQDVEAFKQVVADLESTETGRPLALAMQAELLYEEGDAERDLVKIQQALDMFQEVKELAPNLPKPYVYRARFLLDNGRVYDALLDVDRALERSPRDAQALLVKAVALNLANRPNEALPVVQELETINPNLLCYMAMADTYFRLADQESLAVTYEKIEEQGGNPIDFIESRAMQLEEVGQYDQAVAVVEQGRQIPAYHRHPTLLRRLGILLVRAGRFDEALSAFQQQEEAELTVAEAERDLFLPVNRFRALLGLGREEEASAQLDLFESTVQPGTHAWPSLLIRRAELLLVPGGRYYDPQEAVRLTDEGVELTEGRFPAMLDRSIEARVAAGQLEAGAERADEALEQFPSERRYQIAGDALRQALEGNPNTALQTLRAPDDEALERIADKLEAVSG
jgi:tetratricopeptide (TPR) repeat protein